MANPSPRLTQLQLDLWRETCRHIALEESVLAIANRLTEYLPLARLLVRRIDPQRHLVETLAIAPAEGQLPEAQTELPAERIPPLLDWCRQGQLAVLRTDSRSPSCLPAVVPRGITGEVLLAALPWERDRFGLLILEALADQRFRPLHVRIAQSLVEPLTAGLRNYEHLRELERLREAAEAERLSLLTRLGREKLADTIIGEQSGLRAVMERVELVARSDVPVLLLGETGTGKELIARTIHQRSSRADRPFVRVNCGAIPPELIDSQLFGHERGAFTGAVETHKGWFERADGGTLLLDEIGELPPAAQVRLLRILQDGWLERVGGHQPIHVDVRIVAATHRDLAAMVAQGRFREDLWYRIAVFPIFLPPLRDRREDIGPLARHFAQRAAIRFGLPVVMPTEEDIALLQSYDWPGNVRELASVIDRAAILGEGRRLEVARALGMFPPVPALLPQEKNLGLLAAGPPQGLEAGPRLESPRGLSAAWERVSGCQPLPETKRWPALQAGELSTPSTPETEPLNVSVGYPPATKPLAPLDEAMRQHIQKALVLCKGRIEGPFGAAALLKINPHTLRARMRKLGIDWRRFRSQAQ
ncbi:MAG: sigma 54-interacting transcriptional regulator [Thermoguttaceae bacterium]|nr:sigma 54-interacting transcriptional regulator [Thermoguttaceae bacterium]MDW8039520.1 sigma 54-interacting transcriptional regulator [Thermoguttaceae bacterium]